MTHDTEAGRLAQAYLEGDGKARERIARECEEQGILAALVAGRLRAEGLEDEFIGAMKRTVETSRGR